MKLAAAPISWSVCEVPGWGAHVTSDRVLAEAKALGFHALESRPPGFFEESLDYVGAHVA